MTGKIAVSIRRGLEEALAYAGGPPMKAAMGCISPRIST